MESKDFREADGPRVGIFWGISKGGVDHTLVVDATSLAEAELYGEFLTHPRGHYEVWESWQRLGPDGLKKRGLPAEIAWHEYEHFPRGRIVFHVPTNKFVIYSDRLLQNPATVGEIEASFGLEEIAYTVQSDEHYRTSGRLRF